MHTDVLGHTHNHRVHKKSTDKIQKVTRDIYEEK